MATLFGRRPERRRCVLAVQDRPSPPHTNGCTCTLCTLHSADDVGHRIIKERRKAAATRKAQVATRCPRNLCGCIVFGARLHTRPDCGSLTSTRSVVFVIICISTLSALLNGMYYKYYSPVLRSLAATLPAWCIAGEKFTISTGEIWFTNIIINALVAGGGIVLAGFVARCASHEYSCSDGGSVHISVYSCGEKNKSVQ